jgi:diketogulonate reductase-like aldo/keto reductase
MVPKLGLGTWDLRGNDAIKAVHSAIDLGYRHIDTAEMYRNEAEIGQGLAETGIARDELFLVSKVWTNHLRAEQVVDACTNSLRKLGVEYLDLYLVHWPSNSVPLEETMEGMARLMEEGKTRQVGVSNFSVAKMERASRALGQTIFCNQVKFHLTHRQDELIQYCQKQNILLTAYTPLDKGRLASRRELADIGESHGKSPLQIALRWLVQQEKVAAIPKASSREHQAANIDIFDFALTTEEMGRLGQIY